MRGKPKKFLNTDKPKLLENPNSILNFKEHHVTSLRAIEQPVKFESSGEVTPMSLHCYLPLEVSRNVLPRRSSSSAHLPTSFNVVGTNNDKSGHIISNDSLNTEFVQNENLSHEWSNITCTRKSLEKEIILDFEQLVVRLGSNERDLERDLLKPRHVRDDRYGCPFQQSGSVETQGDEAHIVNSNVNANLMCCCRVPSQDVASRGYARSGIDHYAFLVLSWR
ncbi:hypothetical protein Tco_1097340 [Tanacetum coccineum]